MTKGNFSVMFSKISSSSIRTQSFRSIAVRNQTHTATDPKNDNQDGQNGKTQQQQQQPTNTTTTTPVDKTIRDKHLANITVTSFYCQSAIEQLAAKVR